MQIGAVFPQTEIGADVGAVRAYAERVQELGFAHILAYDHVVGADPAVHTPLARPLRHLRPPSTSRSCCSATSPPSPSLELVTGVIILPQRQTALVAKQAAEVDLLTGGQLPLRHRRRLERRRVRGARQELHRPGQARGGADRCSCAGCGPSQSVTFDGEYETVTGAGLAPMPVQRPIPIWLGGSSPAAYRRAGRLADGWFPQVLPGPKLDDARAVVDAAAKEAGP